MEALIDLTDSRLVIAISRIREAWQEAAEGESLMNVRAPVGLLLADFVMFIELPLEARTIALGPDLLNEYQQMTNSM